MQPRRSGFTPTITLSQPDATRRAKQKAQFANSSPDCKKGAIRGLIGTLQSKRYAKRTLQRKTYSELSIVNYQLSIKPAFTLIEIMVVMIIMAVVMALGVTGWLEITKTAHTNNTRMILSELSAISTDYHARTGNYVHVENDSSIYKGNPEKNDPYSIETFINAVYANAPKTAELFDKLNPEFVTKNNNGRVEYIKDSWGQYIRYTMKGSEGYGMPRRVSLQKGDDDQRPYFASAGPDGKWIGIKEKDKVKNTKDNIYSFNLKSHKHEGGRH